MAEDDGRQAAQKKTFTRWCNTFLSERVLKIEDLFTDLSDGILLINLLELISSKNLGKYDKKPKIALHKISNVSIGLNFIKSEGLKLVNIGPDDIHNGTPKLILGLIWTLILRYQIQMGGEGGSPKQALLDWLNKQIKPYGMEARDFTESLRDGKILNALADSLRPGIIDVKNLSGNPVKDVDQAFAKAFENFQIPRLLDPEDLVRNPDEHSNMTYVSFFRDYLENKAKQDDLALLHGPMANKCFAEGRGVDGKPSAFRGRPLPFTIHSLNKDGQPVTADKYKRDFTVDVKGPKGGVPVDVKDNHDGTYSGVYVPNAVGDYGVDIKLKGPPGNESAAPISGSVYKLAVREPTDPGKSWAEGEGLTLAFDDQPAYFTVHCVDKDGKGVVGEDTLAVAIKPAGSSSSKGPVEVAQEGPKIEMRRPKFCEECGDTLTAPKFCENCGWKIIYKPVEVSRRGSTRPLKAVGSEEIVPEITDNKDGTYRVKYKAHAPGEYLVNVSVHEGPIRDMPSHLTVLKGVDASQSTATGRGVTSPGFADRPHPFVITTRDRDGNPVKNGGQKFKVAVNGPKGPVPCDLVDNKDGTYSGVYVPTALGEHVVDIKLDTANKLEGIKQNPFKIQVKQGADPNKSYAEGEGTKYAMDNRPGLFTVYAKDKDGKPVTGEWVDVKVTEPRGDGSGPSLFPVKIVDKNDGTYAVQYDADKPGDYKLHVTIGDKPIRDMPTDIKVYPGVDPTKCQVQGPGVEKGAVNRELPFTISARDKNGNAVPVGGDDFKASVVGPNGPIPCKIKDNGDGTYTGSYVPTAVGPHKVMLNVNDDPRPVGKAPYICNVTAGVDPSQSYAKGKGWKYAYDNVPTSFTVYCKDAAGKPVAGEEVRVVFLEKSSEADKGALSKMISLVDEYMLRKKEDQNRAALEARNKERAAKGLPPLEATEGDVPVEVTDNKDGTYTVNYVAAIPGKYEVSVLVGPLGQNGHIKKSPKIIPVHWSCPNAPCAHTQKELHTAVRDLRKENEKLKEEIARLTGRKYEPEEVEDDV